MIYCVIATDKETGNEWVMPKTAETIVEIGAILDDYRESDERFEYRLELVNPGMEVERPTLPSYVIRPFTARELFPPAHSAGLGRSTIPVSDCQECGAYVKITMHVKHAEWHNKVADL